MSGTDLVHSAISLCYQPTRVPCNVRCWSGTVVSRYACATRCPVLTSCMVLSPCVCDVRCPVLTERTVVSPYVLAMQCAVLT
eukprot:1376212-Rhodomonas_salina.1